MPKSEIPTPLKRKKEKGKREKCGEAAYRLHGLTVKRFNKLNPNLFNFSTIQLFNKTNPV